MSHQFLNCGYILNFCAFHKIQFSVYKHDYLRGKGDHKIFRKKMLHSSVANYSS